MSKVKEKVHPLLFSISNSWENLFINNIYGVCICWEIHILYTYFISTKTRKNFLLHRKVRLRVIQLSPDFPGFPPIYLNIDIPFKLQYIGKFLFICLWWISSMFFWYIISFMIVTWILVTLYSDIKIKVSVLSRNFRLWILRLQCIWKFDQINSQLGDQFPKETVPRGNRNLCFGNSYSEMRH